MGNSRRPIMPGGPFRREDREELRIQLESLGKIPKKSIDFEIAEGRVAESLYPAVPYTPTKISDFTMKVGEGFAGPPVYELAHIDLLIGVNHGPVGQAIEEALETQKKNDESSLRIIWERPRTLLVPTVTVRTKKQAMHIYEDAMKGVNLAIEKSIKDGILPDQVLDDICMIANVFVHPAAANRHRIMFNNYKAMLHATKKALEERPTISELLAEKECARHPFKYTP
jgi:formaldehyde-activating enzyme